MIRVFIGYDKVEAVAFHTLCHSIWSRSSEPVEIIPIMLSSLKTLMWRDRDPKQSNDFAFSRWLVPYLCQYEGKAIFMDCDMLVVDDIAKLWERADDRYAVQVVKHDHRPYEKVKFLGQKQTQYEKKNWSSVMIFNNARCKKLTPLYINTAPGLDLHQFKWLESDELIGELPLRWNYLVGYYHYIDIKYCSNLHFTIGGPYFDEYKNCDYADIWREEHRKMVNSAEPVLLNYSEASQKIR